MRCTIHRSARLRRYECRQMSLEIPILIPTEFIAKCYRSTHNLNPGGAERLGRKSARVLPALFGWARQRPRTASSAHVHGLDYDLHAPCTFALHQTWKTSSVFLNLICTLPCVPDSCGTVVSPARSQPVFAHHVRRRTAAARACLMKVLMTSRFVAPVRSRARVESVERSPASRVSDTPRALRCEPRLFWNLCWTWTSLCS